MAAGSFGEMRQIVVDRGVFCTNCCAQCCAVAEICIFLEVYGGFSRTHNPLVPGSSPGGPTLQTLSHPSLASIPDPQAERPDGQVLPEVQPQDADPAG